MSDQPTLEHGAVRVSGRRTPMVLSVARCLHEGLARGGQVPSDPKTVALTSATDSQRAYVSVVDGNLVVTADSTDAADLTWQVQWPDPVPSERPDDTFGTDVAKLLSGRDADWRTAADSFWSRAGDAPGMPAGLKVFCADDESETTLGEDAPDAQGVFGTIAALTRFFEGRSMLIDELEGGEFGINVTYPVLSALFGANQKVVCGEL